MSHHWQAGRAAQLDQRELMRPEQSRGPPLPLPFHILLHNPIPPTWMGSPFHFIRTLVLSCAIRTSSFNHLLLGSWLSLPTTNPELSGRFSGIVASSLNLFLSALLLRSHATPAPLFVWPAPAYMLGIGKRNRSPEPTPGSRDHNVATAALAAPACHPRVSIGSPRPGD